MPRPRIEKRRESEGGRVGAGVSVGEGEGGREEGGGVKHLDVGEAALQLGVVAAYPRLLVALALRRLRRVARARLARRVVRHVVVGARAHLV